jgi:hypothetical protein
MLRMAKRQPSGCVSKPAASKVRAEYVANGPATRIGLITFRGKELDEFLHVLIH